jgi:beta-lactam-binding protein with PASTA domain
MSLIKFIKSRSFLKQLIWAGIGLALFVFVVMKWLQITTHHNQRIEVPDLKELSVEEMEIALGDLDLRWIIIDSASYNPNFPKKSVINHDPEPGQMVKEKRKIYITLNPSGYRNVALPDLLGRTKRQAVSQLRAVGFRISEEEIYVKDIGEDVVRGILVGNRELNPGDLLPKNSILKLKLGDGKGTRAYKPPSQ